MVLPILPKTVLKVPARERALENKMKMSRTKMMAITCLIFMGTASLVRRMGIIAAVESILEKRRLVCYIGVNIQPFDKCKLGLSIHHFIFACFRLNPRLKIIVTARVLKTRVFVGDHGGVLGSN
jgi:hypothetical protein